MAEKDLAVGEEIADDLQYRDQRDTWHGGLRTEYLSLKSIFSRFYGDAILSNGWPIQNQRQRAKED
jgi:hypothetical protein